MPNVTATEPVYAEDANGVRRLIAAPGDSYDPNAVPVVGVITTPGQTPTNAPLDDYDTLTEEQLLERLPSLSRDELAAVQAYERAHQARGSITRYGMVSQPVDVPSRAARATAGTPEAGTTVVESRDYSDMPVDELQAEVDRRGLEVTGTGKDGNVVKADLVKALQDSDGRA
jgi:hypothetical protein